MNRYDATIHTLLLLSVAINISFIIGMFVEKNTNENITFAPSPYEGTTFTLISKTQDNTKISISKVVNGEWKVSTVDTDK